MANTSRLKLTGLLVLILGLTFLLTQTLNSTAQLQRFQDSQTKRQQLLDRKLSQDRRQAELDRAKGNFKRTKELLIKKGVPFDPDVLLTPNWRNTLAPRFEQLAEMEEVKIGPGRLKGVQMAHTLYLPEKVQLVGDTVILARNLVFEGRDAVIKGNFSIAVYPIDQTGLLGSTLDEALKKTEVRFINASFRRTARSIPANLPLMNGGSLTIDTSGRGYKQWLEAHALAKVDRPVFVHASFRPQDPNNTSGGLGEPGATPTPGADGAKITTVGKLGDGGTCGNTSSVNGKEGGIGLPGNPGLRPTQNGGTGGGGGHAAPISFSIPDGSTVSYFFKAEGGAGGPGGPGGQGGTGSAGGRGGQGGPGANCPCDQGGSGFGGTGGPGGPAGPAGPGSDGGQGGSGGDGKDISVSYPALYDPSKIQGFAGGGPRGDPGVPGPPGFPGAPGEGGPGGLSGGATNCQNAGWGGETGKKGTPAGEGTWGGWGKLGEKPGADGKFTATPRDGTISRTCRVAPVCDWPFHSDYSQCCCADNLGNCAETPIVVDIEGDGFRLTSAAEGVHFDLNADGVAEHLSWTAVASDDAFLGLDLNQNGMIDSGAELFGNHTPQPPSPSPNGFIALAEFDKEENGGNGNGIIDGGDAVYARLLLWRDTNHNGKSDPGELSSFAQSGVNAISLDYKRSNRSDDYGNLFFYRSKMRVAKRSAVEHWAYDVFLVPGS